jgi:hypothetical protein
MATKPKNKAIAKASEPDAGQVKALKTLALRPTANAAAVIAEYGKPFGEQDIGALMESLSDATEKVWDGDMKRCEAMLLGQAHALQSIFMSLSRKAANQEYLKQFEANLRLALKAQSQCVRTLEVLGAIKNPPVVFAKQANIAHGPQQVNNGTQPAATRTEKPETQQTQLLEQQHGERLDFGAAATAGGIDTAMATVGEVHRPQDGSR